MPNKDIVRNLVIALLAVVIGAPLVYWAVMGFFYALTAVMGGTPLPAQQ